MDNVLPPDLHRDHLGLEVGTGHVVEAPQDFEAERDGEGPTEDAGGDRAPRHPRSAAHPRAHGSSSAPAAGPMHEPCQHRRSERAKEVGKERHPPPHLVEDVGRREDGDQREQAATKVEQRVPRLGRQSGDRPQGAPEALPRRGRQGRDSRHNRVVTIESSQPKSHGVQTAWHTRRDRGGHTGPGRYKPSTSR